MKQCSVEGCGKTQKYLRRGYCSACYTRFIRSGTTDRKYMVGGKACSVENCNEITYARGWCRKHYHSEYFYPEYIKKNKVYVRRTYKINKDKYSEMMSSGCMVCGSTENLCIDHDHSCCPNRKSCGECIRGVLCSKCNFAEGYLDGNVERVLALADYLIKYEKSKK